MSIAELKPLLAPIFRVFQKHLSRKGLDIPFMYDIKYIHNFLKDSSVPMEASLPITTTVSTTFQPSSNTIIPSAMAAMGHRQDIKKDSPTPTQYRRNNNQF